MKSKPDIPVIDLNQRDWGEVTRILAQYVPEYAVWAFGSRVSGPAKTYSDLDIAILTDQPLSLERMATIRDAFDESDLPIRVDVVDWASTGASFREIIRQSYVVIQEGARR
jgi:type I restriction enzyme S subunit